MSAGPVGVAIVGCGTISTQYLDNLTAFPDVRVVACSDLDAGRAAETAQRYGIPVVGDTAQVVSHPDVEIVVNLTIPAVHTEVDVEERRAHLFAVDQCQCPEQRRDVPDTRTTVGLVLLGRPRGHRLQ